MNNYSREIEELKASVVYAYQNWEIWWFYNSEVHKYKNVYNKYLLYFGNARYAHWTTAIMSVWCLIDDKNISLVKLYRQLCEKNLLDQITRKEIESRFERISHIIKGIKLIRHQVVAHISEKIDAEQSFIKANLQKTDLRDIIVQLGNILNIICDAIGESPIRFDFRIRADQPDKIFDKSDIEKLFIDLKNNIK